MISGGADHTDFKAIDSSFEILRFIRFIPLPIIGKFNGLEPMAH